MPVLPDLTAEFWKADFLAALAITILAYLGIVLYSLLFYLALFNIYNFLLKQGKWKVYPLALFYFFSLGCIVA